jgi:hypothetical protein
MGNRLVDIPLTILGHQGWSDPLAMDRSVGRNCQAEDARSIVWTAVDIGVIARSSSSS